MYTTGGYIHTFMNVNLEESGVGKNRVTNPYQSNNQNQNFTVLYRVRMPIVYTPFIIGTMR